LKRRVVFQPDRDKPRQIDGKRHGGDVANSGVFKLIHPPEAAAGLGWRQFNTLLGGVAIVWQHAICAQPLANQ
jgi:hypothetical protein